MGLELILSQNQDLFPSFNEIENHTFIFRLKAFPYSYPEPTLANIQFPILTLLPIQDKTIFPLDPSRLRGINYPVFMINALSPSNMFPRSFTLLHSLITSMLAIYFYYRFLLCAISAPTY
jgi:hypothetical protein